MKNCERFTLPSSELKNCTVFDLRFQATRLKWEVWAHAGSRQTSWRTAHHYARMVLSRATLLWADELAVFGEVSLPLKNGRAKQRAQISKRGWIGRRCGFATSISREEAWCSPRNAPMEARHSPSKHRFQARDDIAPASANNVPVDSCNSEREILWGLGGLSGRGLSDSQFVRR